jgi:AraC-like DNA-binding protein
MILLNSFFAEQNIAVKNFVGILLILFAVYVFVQTLIQYSVNKKSNRFLVFLMVQMLIITIMSFLSDQSFFMTKYFIFIFIPTFLYFSPTIYLYVKSLIDKDFVMNKKRWLHFLLPTLALALFFPVNMLLIYHFHQKNIEGVTQTSKFFFYMNAIAIYIIPAVQLLFYGTKLLVIYRKHLKGIPNYFSNMEETQMKWVRYLIVSYIIYMIIFVFVNLDVKSLKTLSDVLYYGQMFLLIVLVGFFGTKQADIFQKSLSKSSFHKMGFQIIEPFVTGEDLMPKAMANTTFSATPTGLKEEKKNEIQEALLSLLENERLYLYPSLNINDLAEKINTNQKYLSVVINDRFGKNFLTFINEFRINEAKKIIEKDKENIYTVEGIGNMVGFNSRSAFINAFKKTTGYTPSSFKELMN